MAAKSVGEVINAALRDGVVTDYEAEQIISAVNAPKADQTVERDNLIEMKTLDALIQQRPAAGLAQALATPQAAQRIGVCARRLEISPALHCR